MVETLKTKGTMKTFKILALTGATLLLANLQSNAAGTVLSLTEGYPDLAGQFVDLGYTYDVGTGIGTFLANGFTTDYTDPSGNDMGGVVGTDAYTLTATFDNNGGSPILASGTLSISGDIGDGNGDTLLLSGDLVPGAAGTDFGYGDLNNDLFEFKFTVTGGSLASQFGGNNASGGINFDAFFGSGDTPFTGSWTTDFDTHNSMGGDINSFSMVPEPSSILFVLVGSILLVGGYRCRRSALRV